MLVLIVALILSFSVVIQSKTSRNEELEALGQEKLDALIGLTSKDPVIRIANNDFEKYISRGPRPYVSVVILTALKSGTCSPCKAIESSINQLGVIVNQQRHKINTPVFIMEVDFNDNRDTFQKLGLSTAPVIVLVPPTKTRKEISLNKLLKTLGPKYQYSLSNGREAEDIGNWVANTAKVNLNFSGSFEIPDLKYIALVIIAILSLLYIARKPIDKIRRSMIVYAVVGSLVYSFCIGGGMFNFIRQTPWSHVNNGKVALISNMSRYQFQAEGYLMGIANLVAGLAAFLYINIQRDGYERDEKGKPITRIWARWIPSSIPFVILIVGWWCIMWVYNYKNGHYNMGHVGMKG